MIYLLDANIFIQAKNQHYGFDFCPAFWDWLIEQNNIGKVASVEKVAAELEVHDDNLADWVKQRGSSFFLKSNDGILNTLPVVSQWAYSGEYLPDAVSTFLDSADYWLVAYAKAHDYTVVTHEKYQKGSRKIKIPNACEDLKVNCIDTYICFAGKVRSLFLNKTDEASVQMQTLNIP